MNNPYEPLIANERAKIKVLRDKIAECEKRIAAFQSLQTSDDDFDAALARKVEGVIPSQPKQDVVESRLQTQETVFVPPVDQIIDGTSRFPKKTLAKSTLKFLRFAGSEDKSIDDFLEFAKQSGITESRQRVRAFLHQYKTEHKLLESDRDGHFRLSSLGVAYLNHIKNEDENIL